MCTILTFGVQIEGDAKFVIYTPKQDEHPFPFNSLRGSSRNAFKNSGNNILLSSLPRLFH